MTPDILEQIIADRAAKRQFVSATNLTTGVVRLIHADQADGAADPLLPAALAAMQGDRPTTVETDDGAVFLNVFNPPLRMIIVGAVHISQALAPMADIAGYHVIIIDPRRAWATAERFGDVELIDEWPDDAMTALDPDRRTAVVTLTHDPKLDDPALDVALRSNCFYIGALGSKRTHARRLDRLTERGFDADAFARINGPIGLDIGAKSPAEIALAILGQVTETLRRSAS
jgi:xanthine dehydrogenase accessory factor